MCNVTVTQLLANYSNAVKQELRAAKTGDLAKWQAAARAGIAAQQQLYSFYQANPQCYTQEIIAMEQKAIIGKL